MGDHRSLYDCFYESTFHETRKGDFLKTFSLKKTDRDRMEAVLSLEGVKNLVITEAFEGKSSIKSDGLLEQAIEGGPASFEHFTAAILTAPHESTAEASGYVARAVALLSEGDPFSAISDAGRALALENLLEPEEVFQAIEALASALCITGQWERAERVLTDGLQKLRSTALDNACKAAVVGKFVPLMRKAKEMTENLCQLNGKAAADRDLDPKVGLPTVSYGTNPALPAASAGVQFEYSAEKGRQLVAKRDLKPGDIVIVEEPFAWTTRNAAALKTHCLHCMRTTRAPIPCKYCSTVCYCGKTCRDHSWNSYHKYECSILNHFYESNELSGMAQLAYRTIIAAGLEALSSPPEGPVTPSPASPFLSTDYQSVYWQESHSSDRTADDLLKKSLMCAFLLRCLQKSGFLARTSPGETVGPREDEILVGSALLRHLQSCACNAYEITETLIGGGRGVKHAEPLELGGAVYTTVSLLNHGCSGNLARHSVNGKFCVVRASRSIRSGEELLDNYGVHFVNTPLAERQAALQRQYFFQCRCVACTEEWETFDKLLATRYKCASCGFIIGTTLKQTKACPQCNKGDPMKIRKRLVQLNTLYSEALQSLLDGRVEEAMKGLIRYYEELEKHVVWPNKELIKCQQAMNQCWSLLGNKDDVP
ncbi:SET and MYND domain-containing protein 4-like [Ischnura elegans]|uniref:SET and MYND domain-containing protein 4-like n=1 Tax=Ischnura elegans TaxID=197161 RepID=UPI001ED88467|nr:SET and MYND domain-containing protein 4-like [Ischnura elegans]